MDSCWRYQGHGKSNGNNNNNNNNNGNSMREGRRRSKAPCEAILVAMMRMMRLMRLKNAGALVFLVVLLLGTFPAALSAQVAAPDCTGGLTLKLSAPESGQGTLLRVELGNAGGLAEVKGEFAGKEVAFWQDEAHADIRRSFLGVDLEAVPGASKLVVTAKRGDGTSVGCTADVDITAGHFVVEKLAVDEKFVQPNTEDQKRAEQETKRLHEIYAGRTPEKLWNGAFRFPVAGPRQGKNFGSRRVFNGVARPPHTGLDIHAGTGTSVHAAQRGRVALAGSLYYAGNAVLLDHGLGVYTFYCHLSKINVKEGEMVDAGALIGLVGATGRVTGTHLHWGLEVNEARVNPLQILPAAPARKKSGAVGKNLR